MSVTPLPGGWTDLLAESRTEATGLDPATGAMGLIVLLGAAAIGVIALLIWIDQNMARFIWGLVKFAALMAILLAVAVSCRTHPPRTTVIAPGSSPASTTPGSLAKSLGPLAKPK